MVVSPSLRQIAKDVSAVNLFKLLRYFCFFVFVKACIDLSIRNVLGQYCLMFNLYVIYTTDLPHLLYVASIVCISLYIYLYIRYDFLRQPISSVRRQHNLPHRALLGRTRPAKNKYSSQRLDHVTTTTKRIAIWLQPETSRSPAISPRRISVTERWLYLYTTETQFQCNALSHYTPWPSRI